MTRQVGLPGVLYPGKMRRKKPTSLHKCCVHTFGKDCIYLMVSAVLTYSSRIHKITPLRSQWKNTWEVPNAQWCTRCNQGNREKRIKSFCGRREKNLHVKSHCIPPGRDKGRSAPETPQEPCLLASQTLSWSRIGLFLRCMQRYRFRFCECPWWVIPQFRYHLQTLPSRAAKLITVRSWLGRQHASLASHISFSHPLYSSATSIAVTHVRGFAISDREVSAGWNKRLMLFRHPSQGSDKGQQVFDVPSCSIWEAACCWSHSDAEEMRGRGDHLQRSHCQRSQMQLLEPI